MLIDGIPNKKYREDPAISQSDIKNMMISIDWFNYNRMNHSIETNNMKLGTAFHARLLEPDKFYKDYVVAPEIDGRSKEMKAFIAENSDKIVLKSDENSDIFQMWAAVNKHSFASKLLSKGKAEQSLFWIEPETFTECKSRFDFINDDDLIVDIKTTGFGMAHPSKIDRYIADYGLYIQNAFYMDAFNTVKPCKGFYFIFVEREPPYHVSVYELEADFIEYGRNMYQEQLRKYVDFRSGKGTEGGYGFQLKNVSKPNWMR